LFIEDGSITNAKIGNVIQSNNYVAGKSGWIINKNGFAEFQNIKARGEIEATSGKLENVIIEKNCEIKGTLKVENIEGDVVKFYSLGNGETITIPPQSFDRIIQVVIIATTHNSKWCRLWLNDDKFFEIKNGGNDRFFYYWNSPSTILKANTAGVFKYDSEDRYFQITVLA
ncbi:TPA: host specificity protein, partial [Proteus mirabilis]|nr:host specificity protein [Proteus mirabilis]